MRVHIVISRYYFLLLLLRLDLVRPRRVSAPIPPEPTNACGSRHFSNLFSRAPAPATPLYVQTVRNGVTPREVPTEKLKIKIESVPNRHSTTTDDEDDDEDEDEDWRRLSDVRFPRCAACGAVKPIIVARTN